MNRMIGHCLLNHTTLGKDFSYMYVYEHFEVHAGIFFLSMCVTIREREHITSTIVLDNGHITFKRYTLNTCRPNSRPLCNPRLRDTM